MATEYHEATPEENDLLTGKKSLLYRHERRKNASSAAVIWYVVLFGQKYTDRPSQSASVGSRGPCDIGLFFLCSFFSGSVY